tara:strand:+ start:143 stop:409 length:267 start_codon:yes stop_codon:yes gene_type:complete
MEYEENPKAVQLLLLAGAGLSLYFVYKKLFPGPKECVNCIDPKDMADHTHNILSTMTPIPMSEMVMPTDLPGLKGIFGENRSGILGKE